MDLVDAGEIGSGHTVTAIYEITPVGSRRSSTAICAYGPERPATRELGDELAFLKIRAKTPGRGGEPAHRNTGDAQRPGRIALLYPRKTCASPSLSPPSGRKLRKTLQVAGFDYSEIERIAREARG